MSSNAFFEGFSVWIEGICDEFEGIDEDIGCMPSNRLLKEKRAFRKGMSCSRTKEKKTIYTKSVNEG